MLPRDSALRAAPRGWVVRDVLLPFAFTRAVLLVVAAVAEGLHAGRWRTGNSGYAYVPFWPVDVWARWDTRWYLRIALAGYDAGPLLGENPIAFYPLYPKLVAAVLSLLPIAVRTEAAAAVVATLLANACAVAALALLHHHVDARFHDGDLAARTVLCLLAFPTALYLSCAYTESLFLLLAVSTLHLAWRGRWRAAACAGALLVLTRPTGVLMAAALVLLARERGGPAARRRDVAWILVLPAVWLGWAAWCWHLTGDPLAALHVQARWRRGLAWPWQTVLDPQVREWTNGMDGAVLLATAGLAMGLLRWPGSPSYAAFALLCVAAPLVSHQLNSGARYALVAFPVFILLAHLARSRSFERAYLILGVALQGLLMAAWARGYWVE